MTFKSVESGSDLMHKGAYEVYVKSCGFSETKGGTECIKFEFVVRSDVEQPYKNKHKFKQFYRDRESGQWPVEKIGKYAHALGIPNGQDFELEDLVGLNCLMVIDHYQDKATGETKDYIYYLKSSEAADYVQSQPSGFTEADEDDGDLPF